VFFWTDHGVSHARGKQFLYEEGVHVPLIVVNPQDKSSGEVRTDLVTQIDIAASSLALAGIDIPKHIQGIDLFAKDYRPRDMIFSARDRCDETVDILRCVRTSRYKYIRNFLPHLAHLQPNQYKDGKRVIKTLHALYAEGKLNELQSRIFTAPRPREELYDLENDPYETVNLAGDASHRKTVKKLRGALYDWMVNSRDLGLIPEPILEVLGEKYGNKYFILQNADNQTLIRDILDLLDTKDPSVLVKALKSDRPSIRYWAATELGVEGDRSHLGELAPLKGDPSSGVRVAAALAMCRLGDDTCASLLAQEIANENLVTSMYAIRGLEMTGPAALPYLDIVRAAQEHEYEFTRRIARRLSDNFTQD
jgi:hypothetical protein